MAGWLHRVHDDIHERQESILRAITTDQTGRIDITEVDQAGPARDEVRIRTAAAGINPVDGFVRDGVFKAGGGTTLDRVGLGWELAGAVTEAGADVPGELAAGTRVAALSGGADTTVGGQAEELVLPASAAAPVPDELDLVDASTIPLNALTADQALALAGEPRGTLLVTGAAGAVGAFAVSLAVERGWRVLGLARSGDRELITGLGGELVTDLAEVGTVEAVLDAAVIGAPVLDTVGEGGVAVAVIAGSLPERAGVTVREVLVQPDGARLAELLADTAQGRWPVRVRAEHPFDAAETAYAELAAGGRGRVVLRV